MRISYRTHPSLEKLQNGKMGVTNVSEADSEFIRSPAWTKAYEIWKASVPWFKSEIDHISVPFFQAAQKAGVKLMDLYQDTLQSRIVDINFSGTLIVSGGFTYMIHNQYDKKSNMHVASLYWFGDRENKLFGYANCAVDGPNYTAADWEWWICDDYKKSFSLDSEEQELQEIMMLLGMCVSLKMFKTYAEVETIYLKPGSKTKTLDCKYLNDTKLPVTLLDSKWFTNLVKSDAFTVRGHFRLQACGTGLKDHKIIWISQYEKTGYTAPARKLTNDTNPPIQ